MRNLSKLIGSLLTLFGVIIFMLFGFGIILAFPVMWCWDYVMPRLFNLPEITYLQALALYLLCGLLFKQTKTIEKTQTK